MASLLNFMLQAGLVCAYSFLALDSSFILVSIPLSFPTYPSYSVFLSNFTLPFSLLTLFLFPFRGKCTTRIRWVCVCVIKIIPFNSSIHSITCIMSNG